MYANIAHDVKPQDLCPQDAEMEPMDDVARPVEGLRGQTRQSQYQKARRAELFRPLSCRKKRRSTQRPPERGFRAPCARLALPRTAANARMRVTFEPVLLFLCVSGVIFGP